MLCLPRKSFRGCSLILLAMTVGEQPAAAMAPRDHVAAMGQALNSGDGEVLFARTQPYGGFSLSGTNFSGRGSGNGLTAERGAGGLGLVTDRRDKFAELLGDQRVHALLIDGKYDFDYDFGTSLPIHPYLGAGAGLALYESNGLSQEGAAVPLFRLSGGIVVRLGPDWDLSLNYKAGYSGGAPSGGSFTGRGQETVDLHALDMGLKLKF